MPIIRPINNTWALNLNKAIITKHPNLNKVTIKHPNLNKAFTMLNETDKSRGHGGAWCVTVFLQTLGEGGGIIRREAVGKAGVGSKFWIKSLVVLRDLVEGGWVGEWLSGWMGEWVNGWMGEWLNRWMVEWVNGWVGEWLNGWMVEWVNGKFLQ